MPLSYKGAQLDLILPIACILIPNIAISKNVVRENDECQLSNGDCTTEKKCGY